ncbi:MAG TPA: hypothetical protein VJW20_07240 [Candidatus Angelobacter sp.]|nr:hypothetical protein [Candidatus Angelobacter sp.]
MDRDPLAYQDHDPKSHRDPLTPCCAQLIVDAVPYIRTKWNKGIRYSYLVHGIRVDGRVQQKVLAYLGQHKTVLEAYEYWARQRKTPGKKIHAERMMRKLKPFLHV